MIDIRSFFNTEYSKLQIANEKVVKETAQTEKIIERDIVEFERINSILKGFIQSKHKDDKKVAAKEVNKFKKYRREVISSIKTLVSSKKADVPKEVKPTEQILRSQKFLLSNIKMSKVEMTNVTIKMNGTFGQKQSQSLQNFDVTEPNPLMLDKIEILRRIDKNLSDNPRMDSGNAPKESEGGGFGNISGLLTGMLGGGIFSKLLGKFLPKLGDVAKVGKIGKIGLKAGKKAIPIIGAVFSVYDLFKTIKSGITDYNAYTKAGDYQAASGVISSSLMGAFGNIINILGAFLPPPIDIAATTVGTGIEFIADSMKETKGRTSGFIGESRNQTAIAQKTISIEKSKGEFVELRPNFEDPNNIYWEYNDGSDWNPVKDNGTGKNLTAMKDKNPIIQSTDPKKPGIQTYQINTKQGIRDIVMKNGQLFMNVPNVGMLPLSTRKQGGQVVKNRTYIVGEHKAESYVPTKKSEVVSNLKQKIKKDRQKSIQKIDDSFKIFDTSMKSVKDFLNSDGNGNPKPQAAPSDVTSNVASSPVPGKTYKTLDLAKGAKDTFGQRFAQVKAPLQKASEASGIPLETLVKFAHVESGLQTDAGASTSSAKGLFQFVGNTWRGMVEKYGKQYGITASTPVEDPSANSIMGALYIKDNMDLLKKKGLDSSEQNLYLLHFLGPGDGTNLIKDVISNPESIAANLFPKAAKANPGVFYSKDNVAKTIKDVYDWAGQKMAIDVSYMNSFDVGSWKLDSDQDAFIHKGEMIIPESPANKIRALAKSGSIEINTPENPIQYDIYSDASFWINRFMPALANVVLEEFGETNG